MLNKLDIFAPNMPQRVKESASRVIFGVTFDAKMTFEKQLCCVSRASTQRLCIIQNSSHFMIEMRVPRISFLDLFGALPCQSWSIAQQCSVQLPIHILKYWAELLLFLHCLRLSGRAGPLHIKGNKLLISLGYRSNP